MLTPGEVERLGEEAGERAAAAADTVVALLCAKAAEAVRAGDLLAAIAESGRMPQIVLRALGADPVIAVAEANRAAQEALEASARRDAARAGGKAAKSALSGPMDAMRREVEAFRARANLSMAQDAQRAYREVVSDILLRVEAGSIEPEAAVAEAVRRLAERGVGVVDYASGRREQPDVAVRRHIQSTVKRSCTEYTEDVCRRMGVKLVEVDSHTGARPSHREWQGRVYGFDGPVEVDGVKYPGYEESGAKAGLREPNCRHSVAPFAPGRERRWSETPDEDEGLDPEEHYKLVQKQRANERKIRAAKREAAALKAEGLDDTQARLRLGRAQAAQRKLMAEHPALRRRPQRERAFGEGGKAVEVSPLNRKPVSRTAYLSQEDVKRRIKEAGVSQARVAELLRAEEGLASRTAAERESALMRAINRAGAEKEYAARSGDAAANRLRPGAQRKHVPGTREHRQKVESLKKAGVYSEPSAITVPMDEVQRLVNEHAGSGVPYFDHKGRWKSRETCDAGATIGYIVREDGTRAYTSRFTIHYSKRGVHIVPSDPEGAAG